MIEAYSALKDWVCDAPTDLCDVRIKEGMIRLVQGLEGVDRSRIQDGDVELSKPDANLMASALDTLPVILQSLCELGQNVKNGQADGWKPSYGGRQLERLWKVIDWGQRIDYILLSGTRVGDIISGIAQNWPF